MGIVNRVSTTYHSPRNLIPFYWGSSGSVFNPAGGQTNPFSVSGSVNPNTSGPNSGPIPQEYATCRSGPDGNCTVALTAGFTAPINIIAWEYNRTANAWFLLGGNVSLYQLTFDSTYTQSTFKATENSYILIQSSAAITGKAYTDGTIDSPKIGPPQEGVSS
jgi:hypothetical protein